MMKLTTVVLLTLCVSYVHAGELYKYVDKDGRVTFSDMPPPSSAKKVERKAVTEAAAQAALPYETREAMRKFPVVLYANECGDPCKQARELLEKRGIPYTAKDPSGSPEDAAALKKLVGALEVPVMIVGRLKHLKGFESGAWSGALDTAGYPKTNPGVKPSQARREAKPKEKPEPAADGAAPAEQTKPKSETDASNQR